MFDCQTNQTPIEPLGSIGFDWFLVRFHSIDYAGLPSTFLLVENETTHLHVIKMFLNKNSPFILFSQFSSSCQIIIFTVFIIWIYVFFIVDWDMITQIIFQCNQAEA